jgi:hypothetical protein
MAQNDVAKLFVNADPGAMLTGALREFCRSWKNQTEVTVAGSHFIQEDSGPVIGQAIAGWLKSSAIQRASSENHRSAIARGGCAASPRHCEEPLRRPRPPKLEERRRKQSSLPLWPWIASRALAMTLRGRSQSRAVVARHFFAAASASRAAPA